MAGWVERPHSWYTLGQAVMEKNPSSVFTFCVAEHGVQLVSLCVLRHCVAFVWRAQFSVGFLTV